MKKIYYLILLSLTFSTLGYSQDLIYNEDPVSSGGYDGWKDGRVPGNTAGTSRNRNIIIEKGHVVFPEKTRCYDLTILEDGSATILPGTWVYLEHEEISEGVFDTTIGNLVINGNLTITSNSTQYGAIYVEGTSTGQLTYDLYVKPGPVSQFISSPVQGETFGDLASSNPNIYSPYGTTVKRIGEWDKSTGTYVEWDTAINSGKVFTSGVGYFAATSSTNNILSFTGTNITEDFNLPVTHTPTTYASQWNLIGNPFACYIRVRTIVRNNFDKLQPGKSGAYADNGTYWTVYNELSDFKIPPGQGFYFAVLEDTTIYFNQGMRSVAGDTGGDDFITGRGDIEEEEEEAVPYISLNLSTGTEEKHYTHIYFTDEASLGLDERFDTTIFGSNASGFTMYTQLAESETDSNYKLGIQAIPTTALENAGTAIPLGIQAPKGQQITIDIKENILDSNAIVYLEDTKTNTWTALKDKAYTFTTEEQLTGLGRFVVHVTNEARLSIDDSSILETLQFISGSNSINIKGLLEKNTKLSVFDMQGRLINSTTISNTVNEHQINSSNYGSGIYIVKVKTPAGKNIAKRVILK
ncbi:T9SS type A sorting domain-containing protein [Formosa undariae]|uniref:T9SS type A sorting domain-containing protein n=1 Tax=Formosa undariae TaxID=1325436 RepID=A0ABV5EW99_9FLAO